MVRTLRTSPRPPSPRQRSPARSVRHRWAADSLAHAGCHFIVRGSMRNSTRPAVAPRPTRQQSQALTALPARTSSSLTRRVTESPTPRACGPECPIPNRPLVARKSGITVKFLENQLLNAPITTPVAAIGNVASQVLGSIASHCSDCAILNRGRSKGRNASACFNGLRSSDLNYS